jgi:excisionase family DNA binding protein
MNEQDEALCYTVREFCELHRVGLSTYYRLKKRGGAPLEILVGRRVLITREAAARWRKEREREAAK